MDLANIKLPSWLLPTLKKLMHLAEELFSSGTGASKKAWVRGALLSAASAVDIPEVPNFIEDPIKESLVDLLIEVVWSLFFQKGATTAKATS